MRPRARWAASFPQLAMGAANDRLADAPILLQKTLDKDRYEPDFQFFFCWLPIAWKTHLGQDCSLSWLQRDKTITCEKIHQQQQNAVQKQQQQQGWAQQ